RKHRALVASASAFLLAVTGGIAATTAAYWQARASEKHARQAEGEARQHADQARGNLLLARQAVGEMLSAVGDTELAEVPQMEPLRRALLEKALRFYQGFLRDNGTDPSVRFGASEAHARVAHIYAVLGQHGEAGKSHQECIGLLQALAA